MLFLGLFCSACAEIGYASPFCFSCKLGFPTTRLSPDLFLRKYETWKASTSASDKSPEAFRKSALYAKDKSDLRPPPLRLQPLNCGTPASPLTKASLLPRLLASPQFEGAAQSLQIGTPALLRSPRWTLTPRPCPTSSPCSLCPLTPTLVTQAMSATPQVPLESPRLRLYLSI